MKICVVSWVGESYFSNPDPDILLMTFPDTMSKEAIVQKAAQFARENWYIDDIQYQDDVKDLILRADEPGQEWLHLLRHLFDIISHYRYENFNLNFSYRSEDVAEIG